jgi:hypothetical protein
MVTESLFDEGAERVLNAKKLLTDQQTAFEQIIMNIWRISQSANESSNLDNRVDQFYRHPHYVFTINGQRGSGKTSLLLTLHHYLGYMGRGKRACPDGDISARLGELGCLEPQAGSRGAVLVLPIIFPNEMEDAEETMENIFAQVNNVLLPPDGYVDPMVQQPREVKDRENESLVKQLHMEVSVGWSFVRRQGIETLERDSLDYRDFVRRRGEQAALSYTRMERWRKFVNKLLDHLECTLLVICIDDTDLAPAVSEGILHAIRMYLSHPRIVTILCVDLQALEQQLRRRRLARMGSAIDSHLANEANAKEGRMDSEYRDLRHYLYKILPPGQRYALGLEPDDIDKLFRKSLGVQDDSKSWFGFLDERIRELTRNERFADAAAWWLFKSHSRRLLSVLSVREVIRILRRIGGGAVSIDLEGLARESPSLTLIKSALEMDNLEKVRFLLYAHRTRLIWDASRGVSLKLGGEVVSRLEPEFFFFEWLLDSELVRDGWRSRDVRERIGKLLPVQGQAHVLPDLHHELMSRSCGIAASFTSLIVPRNCLYLSDLLKLEASWVDGAPPDTRLTGDWVELFKHSALKVGGTLRARTLAREDDSRKEISRRGNDLFALLAGRWRRLDSAQPNFAPDLFQFLWVVWRLVQTERAFASDLFLEEVERFGSFFKDSRSEQEARELEAFIMFLAPARKWLLDHNLTEEAARDLLRMALTVALEEFASPPAGNLVNLHQSLEAIQERRRAWALLGWAAVPAVRKLREIGLREDEIAILKKLAGSLAQVRQWLDDPESALDLIDIFSDWRPGAIEELDDLVRALSHRPGPEESLISDPRRAFSLDAYGQIAALLGLSAARAKSFADRVRG